MKTDFPGFSSPAATFDEPLKMLDSCHRRMERQFATLQRLSAHLAEHGVDDQTRGAAVNTMRYFDTAAVNHHADEEESLFPALLDAVAGSDAVCLRALIEGLATDHRMLEGQWQALRPKLDVIAKGQPAELAPEDVDRFIANYTAHLQREDDELLPMAERLLGAAAIEELGIAMQKRRQTLDK